MKRVLMLALFLSIFVHGLYSQELPTFSEKTDISTLLEAAGKSMEEAEYKKAITLYNIVLKKDPKHEEAFYQLALANIRLGNYEESITTLDNLLEINPRHYDGHVEMGWVYGAMRNDLNREENEYKKAIEINPSSPRAYNGLGLLYQRKREFETALRYWDKAIEVDPRYLKAYVNRCLLYLMTGQRDKADSDIIMIQQLDPVSGLANAYRGQWYLNYYLDFEKAIEEFDRALELNPGYEFAQQQRAATLMKAGKTEEACAGFQQTLEINPRNFEAVMGLGVCFKKKGEYQSAIEQYSKSIEINPMNDFGFLNRADVYALIGEYEKARLDYNRTLELITNYPPAWYNRGKVLHAIGRHEEAVRDYNKALELSPDNPDYLYNKAVCLDDMKMKKYTIEAYRRFLLHTDEVNTTKVLNAKDRLISLEGKSTWHRYQPTSINKLIDEHNHNVTAPYFPRTNWNAKATELPYRISVTYTGKTRALSETSKLMLGYWKTVADINIDFISKFQNEMLFKDDSGEYWMPYQEMLFPDFKNELVKSDTVLLFVMFIGSYQTEEAATWIFLVNNFESSNNKWFSGV